MPAWVNPISIALLTIAVGHILWAVARWTYKTDQVTKDMPGKIEVIKKDIESLKKKISKVHAQIGEMLTVFPRRYVAAQGPVRLTDLGKRAAIEMDVYSWAAGVVPDLLPQAKEKEEFEIYEICTEYVQVLNDDDSMKRTVAAYAYEHGSDSDSVLTILMVVLRDELLRLVHPLTSGYFGRRRSASFMVGCRDSCS